MRQLFLYKNIGRTATYLFLIAFSCTFTGVHGQELSIEARKQPSLEGNSWLTPPNSVQLVENPSYLFVPEISSLPIGSFHTALFPSLTDQVIPAYAQENPSGYTYLCRMELEVEKNLPIPVWFRAGKINGWETYNSSAMYLQVKLLGFKK